MQLHATSAVRTLENHCFCSSAASALLQDRPILDDCERCCYRNAIRQLCSRFRFASRQANEYLYDSLRLFSTKYDGVGESERAIENFFLQANDGLWQMCSGAEGSRFLAARIYLASVCDVQVTVRWLRCNTHTVVVVVVCVPVWRTHCFHLLTYTYPYFCFKVYLCIVHFLFTRDTSNKHFLLGIGI